MAAISGFFLGLMICLVSVFMVLLILIQRGRGGGITGALGGPGGQSAFGSKAGDVFTRITVVTAGIWIFLCMLLIVTNNRPDPRPSTAKGDGDLGAGGAMQSDGGSETGLNTGEGVAAPGLDDLILPGDEPADSAPAETAPAETAPAETAPPGGSGAGNGGAANGTPSSDPSGGQQPDPAPAPGDGPDLGNGGDAAPDSSAGAGSVGDPPLDGGQ